MQHIFFQKYKAATILEVSMVIAIIGIMTSVVIVSLQTSKSDSRFKAGQREVSSAIKLAQSYALQGKVQGSQTPCAYGFRFLNNRSYEIFYKNYSGSDCDANSFVSIESYTLPDGVTLRNFTGGVGNTMADTEVYFSVPFGKMYKKGGTEVVETNPAGDTGGMSYFVVRYNLGFGSTIKYVGVKAGGYVMEYET